ncbi:hypothetical protein M501DRAFT_1030084 [Patellaria atrata CBS 101060]|uniref:Uncharacterized protein n=1 Tax=Patellaria atrata CBS 101060 TaxID=1346257 RepID=A0A9P4SE23_9PEZI|nr:hypothetical protein M501DRAFT_1030084 [Patellaria atrata CBS 101060]
MQLQTLLPLLLSASGVLSAAVSNNDNHLKGRQAIIGSIDRFNAAGCTQGCHVREQGDVLAGVCQDATPIRGEGDCNNSASISALSAGCSITVWNQPGCTGQSRTASDFGICLQFDGALVRSFSGSCP